MDQVPRTLAQVDPSSAEHDEQIRKVIQYLRDSYNEAAQRANETGLPDCSMQIIHSDWHPGNMLFRGPRVVAVIDYDSARLQQRVIDVANGALQFSILGGGEDASAWPEYMDESRFKQFLRGYHELNQLDPAEVLAVPWLMIEALIAETTIPIAATGSFARMEGFGFLLMIERKVRWLRKHADELSQLSLG
jgi:homoserine kinase type II